MATIELQLATAAFQPKLDEVKKSLDDRGVPWYPYDTFGSTRPLDELLGPSSVDLLKALAGDRPVLDIGCGDGEFSFFLESLGCQVDAVDFPPTNHNGMRGIRCLQEALGSQVAIHAIDLDAPFELPRPFYGLTLFLGILYHLKNPFHVLEKLAKHTQFCLLSTRIAQSTPRGARMDEEALAYLVGDYELNADESNYWIFSEAGLRRILERSGWRVHGLVRTGNTTDSEPVRLDRDERAICFIESVRSPRRDSPQLIYGWHGDEGGWRWTAREFAVEIARHPMGLPLDGKRLEFRFFLNPDVAATLGSVTLRARIGDADLGARTFEGAGEHTYAADLPAHWRDRATMHDGESVRIEFALERAYQPVSPDSRELGLQVTFEKTGAARIPQFTDPVRIV